MPKKFTEIDCINYLEKEAKRYFPTAKEITVEFDEETTRLTIDDMVFECEAGSDDDWFVFICLQTDTSFTIPFHPEM